jgi:CheY-like chemotaxis protein
VLDPTFVLASAAVAGGICGARRDTTRKSCSRIMNTAQGLEAEPASEPPPTILVVDDVVLARMVAASQLRHHGFAVIEVSSADEAMRILNAPVKVDLVFADVNLEGSSLDGFGLSRWVRDNKPAMKVLLTSGVVGSSASDDETVLPKPYKYEELLRRIRALLASDR